MPAEAVAVNDVLDAAVAAWSCRGILAGEAIRLPGEPERFLGSKPPNASLA